MRTQNLMRRKFRLCPILLACTATGLTTGAQAVALGPVSTPIFISKPFSVSVPVGESEDPVSCISVTLHYGDTEMHNATFQLRNKALRVRSSTPIDEPLVQLSVTADCDNPITRSYTLFAEMPQLMADEPKTSAKLTTRADDSDAADTKYASNKNFFGIESDPNTDYIIVQPPPGSAKKAQQAARTEQAKSNAPAVQAAAGLGNGSSLGAVTASNAKARLELDNAELLEKDPHLRLAFDLLSAGNADPAAREETRARWAALSEQMSAPSAAETSAEIAAIARRTEELALQMRRSQDEIAQLKMQLAQEKHGSSSLRMALYGVLGLLLAGLGLLGLSRWRQGRAQSAKQRGSKEQAWWQQYSASDAMPLDTGNLDLSGRKTAPVTNLTGYVQELPVPEVAFDSMISSDFVELEDPAPLESQPASTPKPARKAMDSLQDTQQQADFYAALGQYQQAEDLLRRFIKKHPETSPLAYLNLLGLYHSAQKREDFDALREHFNRVFNAQVPDFDRFKLDPRGLESYPDTLEQLQQFWGSSEVIRLMEDALLRHPDGQKKDEAFAPVAYRELLLLYGIASDTTAGPEDVARMKSVAASAKNWLQAEPAPDTIPLNLHSKDSRDAGQQEVHGFTDFNTGPSPLDDADPWRLSTSRPPEHMDLDLDLDTRPADIEIDFPLSDERYRQDSAPDTINLGVESMDFEATHYTDSNLDIPLQDAADTIPADFEFLAKKGMDKAP